MVDVVKPYKYLYYRIYSWNLRTWGESDLPRFNALIAVSFLIVLNFYIAMGFIGNVLGTDIFTAIRWDNIDVVVLGTLVGAVSYFILIRNDNYKEIVKQFEKEERNMRIRNLILCVAYVTASFVLFFCMF